LMVDWFIRFPLPENAIRRRIHRKECGDLKRR
jgi:hypothetical protein